MVDGYTRRKLWHIGYSSSLNINDKSPIYLKLIKYYLKTQPNSVHSCHKFSKKKETNEWVLFLLSCGFNQTLFDPTQMTDLKNDNKLVTLAKLDDSTNTFLFPKSIAIIHNNSFVVCDTGNSRVVGFNSGGVQTFTFNNFNIGNEPNRLFCPISGCGLANEYAAIADYENSTITVLSHQGKKESVYACHGQPICACSDLSNILYVLTRSQTIECYSIIGERIQTLQLFNNKDKFFTLMAAHSTMNEIYLSKSNSNEIFIINKNGCPLRNMKLNIPGSGLNIFISSIYFARKNIIVADSVNRCVLLFDSENGKFEEILLNGKSGVGCIQSVVLSPTNQIIITEFSLNQQHSVKIFSCNVNSNSKELNNAAE